MRGINSDSIDLIYLDPPFNSNQNYAAPIGSEAAGAAFKDAWTLNDLDVVWHNQIADVNLPLYRVIEASGYTHGDGMKSYLIMMAVRLLEMHRILKSTGSIYLHCDPTASHYLKTLMDAIFGRDNFRNEIVWSYGLGGSSRRIFSKKHDILLFYTKSDQYKFDKPQVPATSIRMKGQMKGATDVWDIPSINNMALERTGYPTQKPLKLLERVVLASSGIDDIVLDPFCGCATTCIAAEQLGRQWIGIDISPKARELVQQRAIRELGMIGGIQSTSRTDIPQRTDLLPPPSLQQSKQVLYGLQSGYCEGCGVHFQVRNLTVDHIIPISRGGTDHLENLQLLCQACNSTKGDRPMEYLKARLNRYALIP